MKTLIWQRIEVRKTSHFECCLCLSCLGAPEAVGAAHFDLSVLHKVNINTKTTSKTRESQGLQAGGDVT